ncbi:MAG: serine hydrolase domain-containing protein [Gemmatimonadota bacterium]
MDSVRAWSGGLAGTVMAGTVMAAMGLLAGGADLPAQATDGSARELVGLWAAERSVGPEVRGPVALREVDGHLWAEIAGYRVEATVADNEIRFKIPGDRGYFRGKWAVDAHSIGGHWVQPWTYSSFSQLASPVTLRRDSAGDWVGTVTPKEDRLRFYLKIEEAEDGRITAFLRNPEANIGRFYVIADVVRDGDSVQFSRADGRLRLEGTVDERFGRLSIYFPLNGGTYDFVRADDDAAVAFYPRPRTDAPYEYRQPPAGEGWETVRPDEVGMAAGPLEDMIRMIIDRPMDAVDAPYIHGFLIARHGKLVLEEYFHGYSRHVPHGTRSASKSMTTTLAGIAEHAGILDLDTPVYETMYHGAPPTDLDPRAARMTLRDLVTMTSGLACDDSDPNSPGGEDRMQSQEEQPDWHRYTLDLPMTHEPGDHAAYCSAGQNLAGGVVSHASGEWLPEFYQKRFAEPVGAGMSYMNLTPVGEAYGGGGLYIKPRDFLKLGQLYLNDGMWNGKRLLDAGWAEAATTPHKTLRDEGYGYGWWMFTYPFDGRDVKVFYAGGNGGQYVIVVPELRLNIVIFGGNYNQRILHAPKYETVPNYVLRAIEEFGA